VWLALSVTETLSGTELVEVGVPDTNKVGPPALETEMPFDSATAVPLVGITTLFTVHV
jgi:hypothetical protein